MKKNFTVNISGILFNIDEDAYARLQEYIDRLNRHFNNSQEGSEIISDIESRIAEMMQDKLSESKSVITIEDIDDIISKMGEPSDFDEEFSADEDEKEEPKSRKESKSAKRFYRNPDDAMIAGVGSGLASYFNIDPILFRLAFVLLTIFGGSGIIIYLVLWVIIPEARTTAQKLEMKGETVNIENIEKKIREEFDNLNDKFHDLKDKHFKKKDGLGKTINDIVNVFAQIILAILKFVGFALAIAFGIASVVLLIMFFIGIFPSGAVFLSNFDGINFYSAPELLDFLFSSKSDARFALSSLTIVVIVPLFSILYNSLRLIFGVRKHTPNLGFAFGVVWIAGAVMFGYSAFQLADEFSDSNSKEIEITENKVIGDTLFVELNKFDYKKLKNNNSDFYLNSDDECYIIKDEIYLMPEINISDSKDDSFRIIIEKSSKGKTERKADVLLNNIDYSYNLTDSLFRFSPFFKIHKNDKWRDQELEIYIYKPENKYIKFIPNDRGVLSESKINRHFKWEFK